MSDGITGHSIEYKRSAELFNSSIATWAVSAAWDIGIFRVLDGADSFDIPSYAAEKGLHEPSLRATVRALTYAEVVEVDGDRVTRGATFEEFSRAKGLFQWLTKGYGSLFQRMGEVTHTAGRGDDFIRRDATAVSIACRDVNEVFMDEAFFNALAGLEFSVAADLGCGSGERLVQLARRDPTVRCVGIDIAKGAIDVGEKALAESGMQHRVKLIQGDARKLSQYPEFKDVDLMTSYLMGHDFWPREDCVALLRSIRTELPNLKYFLLADTHRDTTNQISDIPLFTLGFETAHALMGQYIPSLEEWESVFEEAGWKCTAQHAYSTPSSTVIFQLEPVSA